MRFLKVLKLNNKNLRCDSCGYTMVFIVSNLFKCPQCGFKLVSDKSIKAPIIKTDLRKFGIIWDGGFKSVQTDIYQLDLLKLMAMSKNQGGEYYYNRLLELVKRVDDIMGTRTDLSRVNCLPRVFLREVLS